MQARFGGRRWGVLERGVSRPPYRDADKRSDWSVSGDRARPGTGAPDAKSGAVVENSRTKCYTFAMTTAESPRTFKTAWFSKAARKALIADKELCDAIDQVRKGQCDLSLIHI